MKRVKCFVIASALAFAASAGAQESYEQKVHPGVIIVGGAVVSWAVGKILDEVWSWYFGPSANDLANCEIYQANGGGDSEMDMICP